MEPEKIRKIAEQCHPIFIANEWGYGWDTHPPTIEELEANIIEITNIMEREDNDSQESCSTGRFSCYRTRPGGPLKIVLEFNPDDL